MFALIALLCSAFAADNYSGEVTLPWRDFRDLYEKGQAPKPEQLPPASPQDYTLDHATYTGQVVGTGDDAWASFKMSVRGQVLKQKGWVVIPLLSTKAALKKATLAGRDAPIFIQNGYYMLITNDPGPFSIDMEFGVSLASADGETGLSLPLVSSGATEVAFSVNTTDDIDFEVANSHGMNVSHVGNVYKLETAIPAQGSLAISWRRDLPEEKAQATRIYAETHVLAGVGEGVIQCTATVNYTVLHQGVDTLRVQMPKDAVILDVKGAGIRDWSASADGTVSVSLNYAALGAYALTLEYERALGSDVPLPKVLDVTREQMFVGVDARSAVELVAGQATGATPIDVRELPPAILGLTDFPVLLAYKARGGDVKLPMDVRTHPDVDMLVTLVDAAQADVLVTPDGRRMVHLQYAVRNNRNQFLRLKMPVEAEIWSASVAGRPVKVAKSDSELLIPLVRSDASSGALSGFLVDLVYVEKGSALEVGHGELRVDLPTVDAPSSMVQLSVYVPSTMKFKKHSDEGTLRQVDWFSAAPELPQLAPDIAAQANGEMIRTGNAQAATLAQGVDPVQVTVPLSGNTRYYEKTLALDESLWASFDYKYKPKK